MRLLDEVVQHLFGLLEVGDNAILHRLDRDDVAGGTAKHLLGFLAHGFDLAGDAVDSDNRRLVDDDAFAVRENEGIGRSKIDREIAGKERKNRAHVAEARRAHLKII